MSIDIRLVRIDDRLIHGQVTTAWAKHLDLNRILVVSDEAANDPMRKFLLEQAAPAGIRAHVLTIQKTLDIFSSMLLNGEKVAILFTNPQDVEKLVRHGLKVPTINIGGMRFVNNKRMLTNFVSVDDKDIESFKYLSEQGIRLELRKVPSDHSVNLMDLLKKESFL